MVNCRQHIIMCQKEDSEEEKIIKIGVKKLQATIRAKDKHFASDIDIDFSMAQEFQDEDDK